MLARAKMCSKNIDDVQSMARETAAHCERLISNAAILREHLREMDEEEERGMSVL